MIGRRKERYLVSGIGRSKEKHKMNERKMKIYLVTGKTSPEVKRKVKRMQEKRNYI